MCAQIAVVFALSVRVRSGSVAIPFRCGRFVAGRDHPARPVSPSGQGWGLCLKYQYEDNKKPPHVALNIGFSVRLVKASLRLQPALAMVAKYASSAGVSHSGSTGG